VLLFADRFIIETKYSFIEFGNFFYLTNFFLAPYAILQNYIGFKQLIVFKEGFNRGYFVSFNRKALFFGALLGLFLLLLAFILNYTDVIQFRFNRYPLIIALLLFTGIVRLYSSSIIAAFEARTSIKTLRKANIYIAGITFVILLMAVFLASSIEEILIYVIFIWLFRCIIHRRLLLHQMKISI
jgi:ABC-type transport system involved in cytochrome c biogenesis permease subunit